MKPYRIRQLAVTTSTNDDARQAAEAGEAEGLVIWALRQSSGRGRHGRAWESPEGNLYCSVLLRPECEAKNLGQYSFVASLALYDTVVECLSVNENGGVPLPLRERNVALKWPNDVLVDGRKISGILLETGPGWLVIGMGLNVLHHPEDVLYPATSLYTSFRRKPESGVSDSEHMSHAAHGHAPLDTGLRRYDDGRFELPEILDRLLASLRHWYGVMKNEGFGPIRAAWLERAQKGPMTVRLPAGAVEGVFRAINENGNLVLGLADGSERAIATGDVFF